jgi:hypothetical protein
MRSRQGGEVMTNPDSVLLSSWWRGVQAAVTGHVDGVRATLGPIFAVAADKAVLSSSSWVFIGAGAGAVIVIAISAGLEDVR